MAEAEGVEGDSCAQAVEVLARPDNGGKAGLAGVCGFCDRALEGVEVAITSFPRLRTKMTAEPVSPAASVSLTGPSSSSSVGKYV